MEHAETTATHPFYLEELSWHHMGMVLKMISYVQFEYPPDYQAAVKELFPGFFSQADSLSEWYDTLEARSMTALSDDQLYTLYISYDLMGRFSLSEMYGPLMEDLRQSAGQPEEAGRLVYRFSLSNIWPFLQAVELYALQTNSLPGLPSVKARLQRLPELP